MTAYKRIGTELGGFEWEVVLVDGANVELRRTRLPNRPGAPRARFFTVGWGVWTGERIEVRKWAGAPSDVGRDLPLLAELLRIETSD